MHAGRPCSPWAPHAARAMERVAAVRVDRREGGGGRDGWRDARKPGSAPGQPQPHVPRRAAAQDGGVDGQAAQDGLPLASLPEACQAHGRGGPTRVADGRGREGGGGGARGRRWRAFTRRCWPADGDRPDGSDGGRHHSRGGHGHGRGRGGRGRQGRGAAALAAQGRGTAIVSRQGGGRAAARRAAVAGGGLPRPEAARPAPSSGTWNGSMASRRPTAARRMRAAK